MEFYISNNSKSVQMFFLIDEIYFIDYMFIDTSYRFFYFKND